MPDTFACEQCQKRYKYDPRMAGKKVKCKACGNVILVPGAEGAPAAAPAAAPQRVPARPQPAASGPCPGCGQPLAASAKICVQCGFNRATGKRMDVNVSASAPAAPRQAAPAQAAPRQARPAAQVPAPVAEAVAGEFRENLPYASPHLALLDQWGTIAFLILGLMAVNYPWVFYLYRVVGMPPLPPGLWKPVLVQFLVYALCTAMMVGVWLITYLVMKLAAKALKFALPQGAIRRLVAAFALPMIVWGVSYHVLYKSAIDTIYKPPAAPVFTPGRPPVMPPVTTPRDRENQFFSAIAVSSLEASGIAVVLAAGTFFFFFRLKKLDYVFCAGIACLLFGGTLVAETFTARFLYGSVIKSVSESVKDPSPEDAKAYAEKLQAYVKSHPGLRPLGGTPEQMDADSWQLPNRGYDPSAEVIFASMFLR